MYVKYDKHEKILSCTYQTARQMQNEKQEEQQSKFYLGPQLWKVKQYSYTHFTYYVWQFREKWKKWPGEKIFTVNFFSSLVLSDLTTTKAFPLGNFRKFPCYLIQGQVGCGVSNCEQHQLDFINKMNGRQKHCCIL